ncbi:unnamed protein product, partial [Brenthis ino]
MDLNKTSSPDTVSSIAAEFTSFKNFIHTALTSLQKQVEILSREVDRMEMSRRRKMLLFHGVAEKKNEDTTTVVTSVVAEHLDLPNFASANIGSSYRLGRSSGDKRRPIVVKFTNVQVRDSVWFAKTRLKGSGITESEFLTKRRHELFLEARRRFGIGKCWTRDGLINIIAPNGSRYRAECMSDIQCIPEAPPKSPKPSTVVAPKSVDNKVVVQRVKRIVKNSNNLLYSL